MQGFEKGFQEAIEVFMDFGIVYYFYYMRRRLGQGSWKKKLNIKPENEDFACYAACIILAVVLSVSFMLLNVHGLPIGESYHYGFSSFLVICISATLGVYRHYHELKEKADR